MMSVVMPSLKYSCSGSTSSSLRSAGISVGDQVSSQVRQHLYKLTLEAGTFSYEQQQIVESKPVVTKRESHGNLFGVLLRQFSY